MVLGNEKFQDQSNNNNKMDMKLGLKAVYNLRNFSFSLGEILYYSEVFLKCFIENEMYIIIYVY